MCPDRRCILMTMICLFASAAPGRTQASTPAADVPRPLTYEQYMAQRGPKDPDPKVHMATLVEYTRENRRRAVANCKANGIEPGQCTAGVPFCALIVDRKADKVVARGCNQGSFNPVLHGEIVTINLFAGTLQAQNIHLADVGSSYDLYTTGESCAMCMGAIMWAGFHTVFFGSNVHFLSHFFSQIMISDSDLARLWRPCPGTHNIVRTQVVGGVLEKENNRLFEEFGRQFCQAPAKAAALGDEAGFWLGSE